MYQDGADERERRIELEESQRAAQLEIQQLRQQVQNRDQQKQLDNQKVQDQGQRIQELQERTQSTTIFEYIRNCHAVLYSRLVPETNRRLMTGKSTENRRGRPHPLEMREWNNFLGEQQDLFEEISNAFPPGYRGFSSIEGLENMGIGLFLPPTVSSPIIEGKPR
ncbi:hypothetical protein E4U22_006416 [Claviceps purpurea]|nr:hypothetical protein E4U22_006416 [Claviceps purpurea]